MSEPFLINRDGPLLRVSFGAPAANDAIVRSAHTRLVQMDQAGDLDGGGILGITGPASMPVVVTIAHAVLHRFTAIAVFDPKLDRYVVAASHHPDIRVGHLLTEHELQSQPRPTHQEPR